MKQAKQLGFFEVFALGLGGTVGSGIFVLLGTGIRYTGRGIVPAVVLGCLVMLLAYFYNILMSSMFIFKGGDYSQKAFLFGPYMTGVSGLFLIISAVGTALYGITMVEYLGIIFPAILEVKQLAAFLLLTLFFLASIKGISFIAKLNNWMTIVLLVAISAFIVFGLPQVSPNFFSDKNFFTNGSSGFFSAMAIMAWACLGTTMGPVSVSSVTKNAKRTIPIAVLVITIVLAIIYGLMSMVAIGVMPDAQHLSTVSYKIFPYGIHVLFILGGGVLGIATTLISIITTMGEPVQQVAEDGWLPKFFLIRTKQGFPWVTRLVFYICGIMPVIFNVSLEAIVSLITIPMMLVNGYLNLKCLQLVKDYPNQWRRSVLHMPMIWLRIIVLAACGCNLFVAYFLFREQSIQTMGMIVGAIGVCLTLASVRLKSGAVKPERLLAQREKIKPL